MGRYFLAIDLSQSIKEHVAEEVNRCFNEPGFKWVKPQNYHITLVFLGNQDANSLKVIRDLTGRLAKDFSFFKMSLESWGAFPNLRRPRVLFADVGGGKRIVSDIADELILGTRDLVEKPPGKFHPHVTVARIPNPKVLALDKPFLEVEVPVSEITLFSSTLTPQGPIYQAVDKFSLQSIVRGE